MRKRLIVTYQNLHQDQRILGIINTDNRMDRVLKFSKTNFFKNKNKTNWDIKFERKKSLASSLKVCKVFNLIN